MMRHENFAAIILTHGRPDKMYTLSSLRKSGYTGRIIIVIDNEDKCGDDYKRLYGDMVVEFDKNEIDKTFDPVDNFPKKNSVVYARNAVWDICKKQNIKWFVELDDDYTEFSYRADGKLNYVAEKATNLDDIFDVVLDFLAKTKAKSVAMMQGGDFMGGKKGTKAQKLSLSRKVMNTFFCDSENPFLFVGKLNDDVNTYVINGKVGVLFFSIPLLSIQQVKTQSSAGGLTEIYKAFGTYVKSFYTVMIAPSCVKITEMGCKERRLHHSICWNNAVPKIIREIHRKA